MFSSWPPVFLNYVFFLAILSHAVFVCLFFVFILATPRGMWDLSFPTRDETRTPCTGSMESWPLDHQGSPSYGHSNAQPWLKTLFSRVQFPLLSLPSTFIYPFILKFINYELHTRQCARYWGCDNEQDEVHLEALNLSWMPLPLESPSWLLLLPLALTLHFLAQN